MTDTIGSCQTLPGTVLATDVDESCDIHNDRPAVVAIQGETDSLGVDVLYFCQECYDTYKVNHQGVHAGYCDWCKKEQPDVRPHRDFEEGRCGQVYQVCGACIKAELESLDEDDDIDEDLDLDSHSPYDD